MKRMSVSLFVRGGGVEIYLPRVKAGIVLSVYGGDIYPGSKEELSSNIYIFKINPHIFETPWVNYIHLMLEKVNSLLLKQIFVERTNKNNLMTN